MSDSDTEALVRERFPWLVEHRLSVAAVDDYPDLRYVTILDERDRPLIGGPAYVVSLRDNQVVTVSASRPPRANLEEAKQQMNELAVGELTAAWRRGLTAFARVSKRIKSRRDATAK
jgi:hypothetical protein